MIIIITDCTKSFISFRVVKRKQTVAVAVLHSVSTMNILSNGPSLSNTMGKCYTRYSKDIPRPRVTSHGRNIRQLLKVIYSSSQETHLRATCHMGSHSVTCHPTQVNAPHLNPSQAGWYWKYLLRRDGRLS